jgi:hypothetical protein
MRGFHSFVIVVIVALACPALGAPIYRFVDLHQPDGNYYGGRFFHASGGKVFGEADAVSDAMSHAIVWDISGGRTDLHPAGATGSHGGGTSGTQYAGTVATETLQYAALWTSASAAPVNLNPAGSSGSAAFDAVDGQQAGFAGSDGAVRATFWRGTATSAVDLHPADATVTESTAWALSPNAQGGYIGFGNFIYHAAMWHGTAASMVDLNPAGFRLSGLRDITDDVQVGSASTADHGEAMLWRGTAASAVSLHPAGAANSIIYGTNGRQHVGMVDYDPVLWDGDSADDIVYLRQYMPEEWNPIEVYMRAIDEDGNIFAEAANGHVIAWVVPEPGAGSVVLGGTAFRLLAFRRRRR